MLLLFSIFHSLFSSDNGTTNETRRQNGQIRNINPHGQQSSNILRMPIPGTVPLAFLHMQTNTHVHGMSPSMVNALQMASANAPQQNQFNSPSFTVTATSTSVPILPHAVLATLEENRQGSNAPFQQNANIFIANPSMFQPEVSQVARVSSTLPPQLMFSNPVPNQHPVQSLVSDDLHGWVDGLLENFHELDFPGPEVTVSSWKQIKTWNVKKRILPLFFQYTFDIICLLFEKSFNEECHFR